MSNKEGPIDIAYQCHECGEWVESSPIHHKMNWCGCGKLGVDDHAQGYRIRVVGKSKGFRKDGKIISRNQPDTSQQETKLKPQSIINYMATGVPCQKYMPYFGEFIGE